MFRILNVPFVFCPFVFCPLSLGGYREAGAIAAPRQPWYNQSQRGNCKQTSMIPDFNDDGYHPAGIHSATLEEIATRFGLEPELRGVQMERVIVNGSFVTDKWEPNDIDCVLLRGPS